MADRLKVGQILCFFYWYVLYTCPKNHWTLQNGGVWLSIAGFWDLQTTSFEIPWFLRWIHSLHVDITCTHDNFMDMVCFFCLIPTSAELAGSNVGNLLICLEKASVFLAGHWSISKLGCFWIQCLIYLDLLLAIWDLLIALSPLPTKRRWALFSSSVSIVYVYFSMFIVDLCVIYIL